MSGELEHRVRYRTAAGTGRRRRFVIGRSQGEQDTRLSAIFNQLGVTRGTYVEFGFPPFLPGIAWSSNTDALHKKGWSGLRLDGKNNDTNQQCHAEWISSANIVGLFRKYGVLPTVDYVSIDIDSADLWVLKAILRSEYRPKVITIEYNSNFPWGVAMAYPDPAQATHVPAVPLSWDGGCFMGSSASAIVAAARELDYVTVDVEPGLDLILVQASLWGSRPVPKLNNAMIYRPFALGKKHAGMSEGQKAAYFDYAVYESTGSVARARVASANTFIKLEARGLQCFVPHKCAPTDQVWCKHLYSTFCVDDSTNWQHGPCMTYPPSDGVPLWHLAKKKVVASI